MREWLVERFTLLGVSFQNWVVVALAIIVIAVLVWKGEKNKAASVGGLIRVRTLT